MRGNVIRCSFQQDASYPGRHNPNLAIAEFFDRLKREGGPSSPDILKSIFWLQQRPGETSADAVYAHVRQAYLREIQGQHQRAVAVYRTSLVPWLHPACDEPSARSPI
jgi:hypothetical protein